MRLRSLRRPRTTAERRAACAADADRGDDVPPLRRRWRPSAFDDLVIAALDDRSRRKPAGLRRADPKEGR